MSTDTTAAAAVAAQDPLSLTRVKVWQVAGHAENEDGEWCDKGTGQISCGFIDAFGTYGFVIRYETVDM
jgi:hypothetical protein